MAAERHVEAARAALPGWARDIDGLHQRAGTPPGRVIELHGTMSGVVCTGCGDRTAMTDALVRVRVSRPATRRQPRVGVLRQAVVPHLAAAARVGFIQADLPSPNRYRG
jgi:NAD-dependent deacetylase